MFGTFDEEARKVLMNAKKEMYELRHPYVGSEHLLLSILKDENSVSKKLKDYNLTYETLKKEIIAIIGKGTKESEYFLYTPLLKRVIENSIADGKENNENITIEMLFMNLLEEGEGIAIRLILGMNINIDDLYSEFSYSSVKKTKLKKTMLEEIGVDLNQKAINNEIDPVIGRKKEIQRLLEILSRRTKNNPLLIGEAGVGKTAIVEELSRLIVQGDVPLNLRNKRIISLDMASAVAGTKYRGEFEERMRKILKEIEESNNIILFIDEIHTLVGAGGAEGAIDASNIFKPSLARNKIRCIGATTTDEYKKFIEEDKALDRRFQKIYIEKPDIKTVKDILMHLKDIYEQYHSVKISEEIVDLILKLSEKYIHDRNQPDKSIDLLDEVCAKVSLKESKELLKYNQINRELKEIINAKNKAIKNNSFDEASKYKQKENILMNKVNELELKIYKTNSTKEVTKEDLRSILSSRTKLPIFELIKEKNNIIKDIEKEMKTNILGQNETIDKLLQIIKRKKMGLDNEKNSSLLFVGGSGVGKTELGKLFGKCLVGKENVIKLDMSEFSEPHSVSKLIGTSAGYIGYNDNKNIFEEIRNKPFSVLILDEIEKANQTVINLFFQILDEGHIKDSKGNVIRFDNVTIIMTSNIGFEEISVGFNKNNEIFSKLKDNFSTSFINRIDNIFIFNKLDESIIALLIERKIKEIKERYKNIKLNIDKNIYKEILKESNYNEFGARKIDKIIKDKIENIIIDNLLKEEYEIDIKELSVT